MHFQIFKLCVLKAKHSTLEKMKSLSIENVLFNILNFSQTEPRDS